MSSIFSKIIAGEIPGRFVYEDDRAVAFLDINPLVDGHTLVVPRVEVDKWTDLSEEDWAHLNHVAQKVGRAVVEVFGAQRAGLVIAGFDVPHTHIHVFPVNSMSDFNFSNAGKNPESTTQERLDEVQRKLRSALAESN